MHGLYIQNIGCIVVYFYGLIYYLEAPIEGYKAFALGLGAVAIKATIN